MPRYCRFAGAPALIVMLGWAGDGVFAGFSGDDLMNLRGHWMTPWRDLLLQLVVPLEDAYRPLGGLAYRTFFYLFGLDPLPWRLFCFSVLTLDLFLAGDLIAKLTGSLTAASAAAAALAYQARMADLYYNGGAVYELLCFAAMLLAVRAYVASNPERFNLAQTGFVAGAAIAAWGAKEMAASLPLLLVGWELCASDVRRRRGMRWNTRNVSLVVVSAVSLAFAWSKASPGNPLQAAGAYRLSLTAEAWLRSTAHYLDQLFYRGEWFGPLSVAATFAGLFAAAVALRRSEARFAVAWIVASALPIAFIVPRSGFAYFIPSFGWALLLGSALAASPLRKARPWAAAAAVAAVLAPFHLAERESARRSVMEGVTARQAVVESFARQRPAMCAGAAVVIEDDPFDDESLVFLTRLSCGNREFIARRAGSPPRADEALLRFAGGVPHVMAPLSVAPPQEAMVRFSPSTVLPGETYAIESQEFAGEPIDAAYCGGRGYFSQVGVIEGLTTLDAAGRSAVRTPDEQAPGTIAVTHVRGYGPWWKANAHLRVLPRSE